MYKLILSFTFCTLFFLGKVQAQAFSDDFESYSVGTYLADSSTKWTTWNNAPGTSEDVLIDNKNYASGSQSIYFESTWGGGPQDVVLPFGGVYNSGHFRFSSKWYVSAKTGAYFNFQGGASIGSSWTLDVYMYDDGTLDVSGYLWSSYPQDQWFELVVDVDLTNNQWEVFIDGNSLGTFTNWTASVSYLDIYPLFSAAFWVDDVSYCFNNSCLPDVSMDVLSVNPDPLCSNHYGDVTINLTNNGPDPAKEIQLGMLSNDKELISKTIPLNDLAAGLDTVITISGFFKTYSTGSNVSVKAINLLGDRNITNDTVETFIEVLPSPNGSELIKGSTFQGIDGSPNPDMIQLSKTNIYEITPPNGYSNSGYPSTWNISAIQIVSEKGYIVPSGDYLYTAPTTSSNGKITFTGSSAYLDSLLEIRVTIENSSSGCDSTSTRKLRVVPTPFANFKFPSSVCVGDDVAFENLSSIHSGYLTFMWYFGDGDSADVNDPYHQFSSAGNFDVRLVATSQPFGISKDTTITVTVNEIPDTKFSVKNNCQGIAVEFNNASSVSNGTLSYEWNFGDGSAISTATNPTHLYNNFGPYKVTLTATSNGCVSSMNRTAYAFEKPKAAFTAPSAPICAKTQMTIANESTISFGNLGTYWTYGDGGSTTLFDAYHSYTLPGTYSVTLLAVSEFDCKDSIVKNVVVKATPTPIFSGNQFCGKIPTVFTNSTVEDIPNPLYEWTFSDGVTSNQKNYTKTWPSEGPYKVTLKVSYSNGCNASISQDINVLIQPRAKFSAMDICSGDKVKFVNHTTGDRGNILYVWDFGDGGNSTLSAPERNYSPSTTTTYTVALVASYAGACSDTFRKAITVSESPICDFTYSNLGLMQTSFTPSNGTYAKYEWFFGEGGMSEDKNPLYQYLYRGVFNVTMKATNALGCSCEVTKKVGINTSVNSVNALQGIEVYPNPNTGIFTVSNANSEAMTIEVYNTLGEKVFTTQSTEAEEVIHLDNVSSGVYIVKVSINGISSVHRLTITAY